MKLECLLLELAYYMESASVSSLCVIHREALTEEWAVPRVCSGHRLLLCVSVNLGG
jgi:hypothetical protein